MRSTSCSYTVNRNGTGFILVTFDVPALAGPFRSDIVIVDNAKEVDFMLSDATGGTVASGVAHRQVGDEED